MSPRVRTILLCITLAVVLAYLVVGVALPRHQQRARVCSGVEFRIRDHAHRQYVTAPELHSLLQQQGLDPTGQTIGTLSLDSIERAILRHPMIRTAQCYPLVSSAIVIAVTQRQPQLLVTTESDTYYIDSDRRRMPVRPSITTPVRHVNGHVSERMAKHEIYDLVQFLNHSRFWRQRIGSVLIRSPRDIRLTQTDAPVILLGDIRDYDTKLSRLQQWYRCGADTIQHATYTELDLRFHSQIVARK